ncbi:MAG: PGPGW domain-containing protein [Nitrospirota bacterium]
MLKIIKTLRQAKRLIKIVIGFTILFIGLAMTVLPGPAIIVIPAALAILATEFIWARRLLKRIKHGALKSPFCRRSRHVR